MELPPLTSNRRQLTSSNSLPDGLPASQSAYMYHRAADILLTDDEDDGRLDAMHESQEDTQVPRPCTNHCPCRANSG